MRSFTVTLSEITEVIQGALEQKFWLIENATNITHYLNTTELKITHKKDILYLNGQYLLSLSAYACQLLQVCSVSKSD